MKSRVASLVWLGVLGLWAAWWLRDGTLELQTTLCLLAGSLAPTPPPPKPPSRAGNPVSSPKPLAAEEPPSLGENSERLRLAMAAGKMGAWAYDGHHRVHWSPELELLFGLKQGEFDGRPESALDHIWPEDRHAVVETFKKATVDAGDYALEFRFRKPGAAHPGWMLGRGRAYAFGGAGTGVRFAGVCLDITERKEMERQLLELNAQLEERVRERTAQLEIINRELEAFSYSVSHDLRAPLRSIRGFGEVLLERYGPQLDEDGADFLQRVCASCQHMDRLIEDLLKLSRVGRAEMQPGRVDLTELADQILEELQKGEPERAIELRVARGLTAVGDERLLRLALDNLLRNAWKFTRDQPRPVIEFDQSGDPEPVFFVRDNGAGFDMAYAGKLFGVFQRLHSSAEFPGTGIGLATVQRIIHRHGGRVWAQAVPGRGATLFFTLPGVGGGKPAPNQTITEAS